MLTHLGNMLAPSYFCRGKPEGRETIGKPRETGVFAWFWLALPKAFLGFSVYLHRFSYVFIAFLVLSPGLPMFSIWGHWVRIPARVYKPAGDPILGVF